MNGKGRESPVWEVEQRLQEQNLKGKKREEREEKGFYLWREGKWGSDMGDLGGHLVCWSHNRTLLKMITAYWSGAKSP